MKALAAKWGICGLDIVLLLGFLLWGWNYYLWRGFMSFSTPTPSSFLNSNVATNRYLQSKSVRLSKRLKNPLRSLRKKNSGNTQLTQAQKYENAKQIRQKLKQVLDENARHPSGRFTGLPRHRSLHVRNLNPQKAIDHLLEKLPPGTRLNMDNVTGTLRQLRGNLLPIVEDSSAFYDARKGADHRQMAMSVVNEISDVMNVDSPVEEFTVDRISEDDLGMTHVTLQQVYKGIPIWGAQVAVYFDSQNNPIEISGLFTTTPSSLVDSKTDIGEREAIRRAKEGVNPVGPGLGPIKVNPIIYWDLDCKPVRTYRADIAPRWDEDWQLFISRQDGRVIHSYLTTQSESLLIQAEDLPGVEQEVAVWNEENVLYAIDTTATSYEPKSIPLDPNKTRGAIYSLNSQNTSPETLGDLLFITSTNAKAWVPTAISVLNNLHQIEAYFQNTFNRKSINDKRMTIYGVIHVGQGFDNAFRSGNRQMIFFGDGNSIRFIELRIPQPDGEPALPEFADILTFNILGDTRVFDAVSSVRLTSDEEIFIWGVYSLRIADSSLRQMVPFAPGTEIANPIFSHT